jgi:ABC-type phosphate transport system substrate-binding protein
MAVVVNQGNPVAALSSTQLAKIFRSETTTWPDGSPILIVAHTNSAGESETLEKLMKMKAGEWSALKAAHREFIKTANTDADILKIVQSSPGAVGLIEVHSIDSTIKVVRIDGKLPMEVGYLPH